MSGVQVSLESAVKVDNVARAAQMVASRPGPEKAISAEEIADRLGVSKSTVRNWPPEIRQSYNVPIGYCEGGYFRIVTEDEYLRERRKFESQAETARENIEALDEAYNGTTPVTYGGGR